MYEGPIVFEVTMSKGDGDRFCGDPAWFDQCDVYCGGNGAFCAFVTAYMDMCPDVNVGAFCLPPSAFNVCTTYTP